MPYSRTLVDLITRVYTDRYNVDRARGYSDVAGVARIAPLAIITNDLRHHENLDVLADTCLSVLTSYYLKALPMSQEIGGSEVTQTLRRLSPDPRFKLRHKRDGFFNNVIKGLTFGAIEGEVVSLEDNLDLPDFLGYGIGLEGAVEDDWKKHLEAAKEKIKKGVSQHPLLPRQPVRCMMSERLRKRRRILV